MADISYTSTRELVGGSPGLIEFNLVKCDRNARSVGKTHVSLSGVTESVLHRRDIEWSITVLPFEPVQLPFWREFEASCANGEEFILDLTGTTGMPATPFVCTLKRDSFGDSRYEHFWYQVSFIAVEA